MREVAAPPAEAANLLDRAIEYVSPARALRRLQQRRALAMVGSFKGAARARRGLQNFHPGGGSANADLIPDLPTLRERSRDLVRNAPLAKGAIDTVLTNVVGTGLKVRPSIDREVLGLDDEAADAWERAAEREWRLFAESEECDYARTLTFDGFQDLAMRATLESGDCLIYQRMLRRPGSPYDLKLQIIEADRVSNPNRSTDRRDLVAGVQVDPATGAPVGYHVTDRHPGDMLFAAGALTWEFLPAFGPNSGLRQVLHLYDRLRPDQARGVPYLAAVIEPLKQLDRYGDAELMAAVINACFAIVTETETGSPALSPLSTVPSASTAGASTDALKRADIDFEAGLVIDGLRQGESIKGFESGRPSTGFDPFVQAMLRQVGVGLGLPFEVLIKHFTASYSAARAALLDAWRFFRGRRVWLARRLCQPTYEAWLTEAVARGRLDAPGFFRDPLLRKAWCGSEWIGDSPGQIDPTKETDAAIAQVNAGLTTLERATTELNGGDFERNTVQRAKERRMRVDAGLEPAVIATPGAAAPPATPAEPPADSQGTSDKPDQKDAA